VSEKTDSSEREKLDLIHFGNFRDKKFTSGVGNP
jgi:hypothetical protein